MKHQNILLRITFYIFLLGFLQSCAKKPFPPEVMDILSHQNRRTLVKIADSYLKSPSTETRYRLGLAIANSRDLTLIPQLEILLIDNSPTVRSAAAFALGQMNSPTAENLLLKHLESESDSETRRQTGIALAQIGSLPSLNQFLEIAGNESNDWPAEALVYYFQRQIYNYASLRLATSKLRNGNQYEMRWSALALSRIRDQNVMRELVGDLQNALATPDVATRIKLVACLSPLNFSGKTDLWAQLLADDEPGVRIEAARGIIQIAENRSVLSQVFNDSVPQVIATAIENLPDSLNLTENLKNDFRALAKHPSPAVQSALVKYLSRRGGVDALQDFDLWPLSDNLLPAVAAGIAEWGRPAGLAVLDSLSRHPHRAISTPAYHGLISVAEKLHKQNILSVNEFGDFIGVGLTSADPIKIAIAASILKESGENFPHLHPLLYPPLTKYKNAEYADAITEILMVIAILQPPDALPFIQPLVTVRDVRIRELARQIVKETYQAEVPEIADDYRGAGRYANLAMLRKYGLRPTVLLETARGNIIIRLDGYYAPFTVDALLSNIESGFYNGLTFHRVVPNFVIQGGDPRGDGWGGPGYILLTEFSPIGYIPGAVGLARTDFDAEGSQFFITLTDQPHLNYKYSRFGEVVDGLAVAAQIEKGDRILAISVLD